MQGRIKYKDITIKLIPPHISACPKPEAGLPTPLSCPKPGSGLPCPKPGYGLHCPKPGSGFPCPKPGYGLHCPKPGSGFPTPYVWVFLC